GRKLPLPAPDNVVVHAPATGLDTVTVTLPFAEPPAPVQVTVYVVVAEGLTAWLPLAAVLLVHDAAQDVARELDQLMVVDCPAVMAAEPALTLTAGACGGAGVGAGDGDVSTPNRITYPVLDAESATLLAFPANAPVSTCMEANGVPARAICNRRTPSTPTRPTVRHALTACINSINRRLCNSRAMWFFAIL